MAPVRKAVASAATAVALTAAVASCRATPGDLPGAGNQPPAPGVSTPATVTPSAPAPTTPGSVPPGSVPPNSVPPGSTTPTSTAPAGPTQVPSTSAPVPVPTVTSVPTVAPAPTRSSSPTPPRVTSAPVTPPPVVPPQPQPSAGTRQDEIVRLTNIERDKVGCGPLTADASLTTAAQAHSLDMAVHSYFSHTGLNGSSVGDRARAAGFPSSYVGENIAAGTSTPAATIQMWMGSAGHRANILNCGYTRIGVGYAEGGSYRYYWTQVFGTR